MDALDYANFSSRASHTESIRTESPHFTAAYHAEPITASSSFTVPDDFSNRANFTNAAADADSLNVEIDGCSEAIRVGGREQRSRDHRPSGRFAPWGVPRTRRVRLANSVDAPN